MAEVIESYDSKIEELKRKLRKYRFDHALGQLDDTSMIQRTRRDIASLFTQKMKNKGERSA